MRQHSGKQLALLLVALSGVLADAGCTRRFRLTPDELARVEEKEGSADDLRVYVRRKTILRHDEESSEESFEVQREVKERRIRRPKVIALGRNTAGKILGVGDRNGMPILWVTFDLKLCDATSCALGFVRTEDERYKLAVVPQLAGYKEPKVFRKREKKRALLTLGKVEALAEANDVYLIKPKRRVKKRRIKTIELDIKKNVIERVKPQREAPQGVD